MFSYSTEGKAMATAYDCKFIETSVGINHNIVSSPAKALNENYLLANLIRRMNYWWAF